MVELSRKVVIRKGPRNSPKKGATVGCRGVATE
jgi:hypothetical protein